MALDPTALVVPAAQPQISRIQKPTVAGTEFDMKALAPSAQSRILRARDQRELRRTKGRAVCLGK